MTAKTASETGTRVVGTTHEGVEGKYDTGKWALNPLTPGMEGEGQL